MEYKYTGIILNKWDIGETDRIYTMYSFEGGKIKSVAKGVRKPQAKLASSLENITLADITIIRGRGLGKITSSIVENNFTAIKSEGEALLDVFITFGVFDKLVDFESPDRKVFLLLREYLESMEGCAKKGKVEKYAVFRFGFLVKLLDELGYAIGVDNCVACGGQLAPQAISFNSELGGVLCGDCASLNATSMPIKVNAVKLLRIFLKNKIETFGKIQASKEDYESVHMVVEDFLRWTL